MQKEELFYSISGTLKNMTEQDYVDVPTAQAQNVKDIDKQLKEYNKKMIEAAQNLEFEQAMIYRDKIKELEQLYLKS